MIMLKIIIFVLFNIALIVAQVFITSGKSWKRGLYIPIFNTVVAIAVATFASPYSVTTEKMVDGIKVSEKLVNTGGFIGSFFGILILLMIPAIINFILYLNGRRKFAKEINDIDRMKIDDL